MNTFCVLGNRPVLIHSAWFLGILFPGAWYLTYFHVPRSETSEFLVLGAGGFDFHVPGARDGLFLVLGYQHFLVHICLIIPRAW